VALKDESIQSALIELRDEFLGKSSYRKEGEYWVIVYDWKIIRLKNTKGLRYIAHLLSKPNHLVRVLDLAAMENKQRIDYDYNHSNMSSEQLGMEGLRKSDLSDPDLKRGQRNASDPLEKARKAVSKNINDALKAVGREHPSLWHHLKNSIKMGDTCTYNPIEHIAWNL
jgi:hypothetical protein